MMKMRDINQIVWGYEDEKIRMDIDGQHMDVIKDEEEEVEDENMIILG